MMYRTLFILQKKAYQNKDDNISDVKYASELSIVFQIEQAKIFYSSQNRSNFTPIWGGAKEKCRMICDEKENKIEFVDQEIPAIVVVVLVERS